MGFGGWQGLRLRFIQGKSCEHANIPSTIEELEEALQQRQALIGTISQGYTEVGCLWEDGIWGLGGVETEVYSGERL